MNTQQLEDALRDIRSYANYTRTRDSVFRQGIYDEVMAMQLVPSRWPAEAPTGRTAVFRRWYALRRQYDIYHKNPYLAFQQRERRLGVKTTQSPKLQAAAGVVKKKAGALCLYCKRSCDCQ